MKVKELITILEEFEKATQDHDFSVSLEEPALLILNTLISTLQNKKPKHIGTLFIKINCVNGPINES